MLCNNIYTDVTLVAIKFFPLSKMNAFIGINHVRIIDINRGNIYLYIYISFTPLL